jgi:hypothetical protein
MLVGHGNNGVLLLGLDHQQLEDLKNGSTVSFENGPAFLATTVILCAAQTREALVGLIAEAGVSITSVDQSAYLRGERTDRRTKPN